MALQDAVDYPQSIKCTARRANFLGGLLGYSQCRFTSLTTPCARLFSNVLASGC